MIQSISLTGKDHDSPISSLKGNVDKNGDFYNVFNQVQKQQKIKENDSEYSNILKQIDDLEQKILGLGELIPESQKLDPLRIILVDIQNIFGIVENDNRSVDTEMLIEWAQSIINFVVQSLEELTQTGDIQDNTFSSGNYLAFVAENIDISFFYTDDVKRNILLQMVHRANDARIESMDSLLLEGSSTILEHLSMDHNSLELAMDAPQCEIDLDNRDVYFLVKDDRVDSKKTEALEGWDEKQMLSFGEGSVEMPLQSRSISSVQRAYHNFSSSVSRVQVEALMQNMSTRAFIILRDGGSEMKMKLTPPELGHMKLSFRVEDGIMNGKIVVGTQEARFFFEENLDNLRQSLASVGIMLSSVDVQLGGDGFEEQDECGDSTQYKAVRLGPVKQRNKVSSGLTLDSIVDYIV